MEIPKVILASKSPFRQEILKAVGVKFQVIPGQVNEKEFLGETPKETALIRAKEKAKSVFSNLTEPRIIIGCDQTLEFDGKLYDKASTQEEAFRRLKSFSDATHFLHSAIVLIYSNSANEHQEVKILNTCSMTMRSLTEKEIKNYLLTMEWKGCVGCYQFENRGANLFSKVEGDTQSIIGLPTVPLLAALRKFNINPLG